MTTLATLTVTVQGSDISFRHESHGRETEIQSINVRFKMVDGALIPYLVKGRGLAVNKDGHVGQRVSNPPYIDPDAVPADLLAEMTVKAYEICGRVITPTA